MRLTPPLKSRPVWGRASLLAAVVACAAFLLAGCGSGNTETVSVSGSPTPSARAPKTTQTAPKKTSGSPSSPSNTSSSPGASSDERGSAPAFVQQGATGEALQKALTTVKAHGYTANDPSQYRTDQTLTVLVGTRSGSGDGYDQQAFFFLDGRYIGTDTSAPSATVKLVGQGDTEVTLAYPLYRSHDPLCCPGGGQTKVRFQLNNGKLVALDPIPPVSSATGLSRQ